MRLMYFTSELALSRFITYETWIGRKNVLNMQQASCRITQGLYLMQHTYLTAVFGVVWREQLSVVVVVSAASLALGTARGNIRSNTQLYLTVSVMLSFRCEKLHAIASMRGKSIHSGLPRQSTWRWILAPLTIVLSFPPLLSLLSSPIFPQIFLFN